MTFLNISTNQIRAGLNWTNRKFVVVEGIRVLERVLGGRVLEDIVIIENNFGSCSINILKWLMKLELLLLTVDMSVD